MSDKHHNNELRPTSLDEFVGLGSQLKSLSTMLKATKIRNEPVCDHILLSGPPGCGKTSLAYVIASELGAELLTLSGPAIEKQGEMAVGLTHNGMEPAVIFIDEIHAMPLKVEETLYVPMEDGVLDIVVGDGNMDSRNLRVPLGPLCVIGATTLPGRLSEPLRSRFKFDLKVDLYSVEDLAAIAANTARVLDTPVSEEAAVLLAGRARGTPRVVNTLVRRARDWFDVNHTGEKSLTEDMARAAMDEIGIDDRGLDHTGRAILACICEHFDGGPVGVNSLASATGESVNTIESVYEPHMLRAGLLQRTGRGRKATDLAWEHLGLRESQETQLMNILDPDDPLSI